MTGKGKSGVGCFSEKPLLVLFDTDCTKQVNGIFCLM